MNREAPVFFIKPFHNINFPLVRKVVNLNYANFGVLSTPGHNNIPYLSGSSTLSEEDQEKVVLLKKDNTKALRLLKTAG
jgi:hypothetical protein